MGKLIDLTGKTFGHITVVDRAEDHICNNGLRKVAWNCKCECGNEFTATSNNLRSNHYTSCGCLNIPRLKEMNRKATHGMIHTRLYRIWSGMKARCKDMNSIYYGGKGIRVCKEWSDSFEVFCEWAMANGYDEKLSIDRIDGNGNYEPSNCRWATSKEQNMNRTFRKVKGNNSVRLEENQK